MRNARKILIRPETILLIALSDFARLIKRLTLLVKRRRLTLTEGPERLDFPLQHLHLLLVLAEIFFEPEPLIDITKSADQDTQKDGAKNDQE